MRRKVAELTGAELDAAVAKAEGHALQDQPQGLVLFSSDDRFRNEYRPSSDWRIGGAIIERERIAVWRGKDWYARLPDGGGYPGDACSYIDVSDWQCASGPTPLIAAMRAYCASRFGDEVEL